MNCDEAIARISAELDGELGAGDRPGLEVHLAGCDACRALSHALRLDDAELRRAFGSRRSSAAGVAARVVDQIRVPAPATVRFQWLPVLLAAAAGFLLAVAIFRPWQTPSGLQPNRSNSTLAHRNDHSGRTESGSASHPSDDRSGAPGSGSQADRPMTQLVFAKGTVEALESGGSAWRPIATGGTVAAGTRVRTDDTGRCEFKTPDGSEVRLNGNTELVFHSDRQLELARGQLWSNVAEAELPYQVSVPQAEAKVTALGTQFDLACSMLATILTVAQGSTEVEGKAGKEIVPFGEQVKIVGGAVAERHRVNDLIVATSWVHEILMLKGHDNQELAARMDDMLAQIGNAKMSFMVEKEILQLGDHCVLPLTRFIQSKGSRGDKAKRANAARILAKIARPWSVGDLIQLLGDDDREVRYYAAKALERLTDGQTQGLSAEQWREAPADRRGAAWKRWQVWWRENQDRFPTAPF